MRGDDTATATYSHPRCLLGLLLAAVLPTTVSFPVSHRERKREREKDRVKESSQSPSTALHLPIFFTLFLDDGILIMWKVRGEEVVWVCHNEQFVIFLLNFVSPWGGDSRMLYPSI